MLYTEVDRPGGRGGRGGFARNGGGQQEQERRHIGGADNSYGPSTSRGGQRGARTGKQRPKRNASIVAGRAIERVSAGRSAPIWTNPDPAEPNMEIDSVHNMPKGRKEPKLKRAQPL